MKALVVGGDGFLGSELVSALQDRDHDVVHTTRRQHGPANSVFLDLSTPLFASGLNEVLPFIDVMYLVAAVPSFVRCEKEPSETWRVNVDAPIDLAHCATSTGIFTVFVSSDAVEFCGATEYGRQKTVAETAIRMLPNAAIFRPSRIAPERVAEIAMKMVEIGEHRLCGLYRWS